MNEGKPVSAPTDTSMKFVQATEEQATECIDQQVYPSEIGSLLHLSVATRRDVTFAVCYIWQNSLQTIHSGVKHIMQYLKGTTNLGILYTKLGALVQTGQGIMITEDQRLDIYSGLVEVQ